MPLFLIGLLVVLTLALGQPYELWREAWPWALAYYGTALAGDLKTTLEGTKIRATPVTKRGYREGNPFYARALRFGPWGMPLVDLGLLSLKTVFLARLTGDPLSSYPLALTIAGHGHLVGFLFGAPTPNEPLEPRPAEGAAALTPASATLEACGGAWASWQRQRPPWGLTWASP